MQLLSLLAASLLSAVGPAEEVLPLHVGNTWVYAVAGAEAKVTYKVVRTEKAGGVSCFLLEISAGENRTKLWLARGADAIRLHRIVGGQTDQSFDPPVVFVKNHLKAGDRWFIGLEEYTVSGPEEIEFARRRYRCMKVTSKQGDVMNQYWFSPGTGIVKWTFTQGTQSVTCELRSVALIGRRTNVGPDRGPGTPDRGPGAGPGGSPNPTPATATEMLQAQNHMRAGEFDKAEAAYGEAIRLQPMYGFAWYSRGWLRAYREKYREALADLNEALRLGVSRGSVLWARGKVHFGLKKYAEAKKDLEEAVRLLPNIEKDVRPMLTEIEGRLGSR